jgi:hypothetical protein
MVQITYITPWQDSIDTTTRYSQSFSDTGGLTMRLNYVVRVTVMLCLIAAFVFSVVGAADAHVPNVINYQGRLTDDAGNVVPDGYYSLTFAIYDTAAGGTPLWGPVTPKPIEVIDGLFTWQLGWLEDFPEGLFEDTGRWLGISVGADPEIDPRTRFTTVPYAYHALVADRDGDWVESGADVYRTGGNVGIGMTNPQAKLDVGGVIRVLRDDSMSEPGEGEGLELMYDPVNRIGVIQVFDRFAGYRKLNLRNSPVGIDLNDPQYPLDVAGACHASSFPTSSDERFKSDVQQLDHVLDKLDQIRGVSFNWNDRYEELGRSTGHREIGVIAQEVEEVFPELVTNWSNEDFKAVDYGRLTAVLIEAVKELNKENKELKDRVEALEQELKGR